MSRDTVIDTALDHIYEFESRGGKIRKREGIGGTVGGFHLTYKDNKDLAAAEGFTPRPGRSAQEQFNDFIIEDEERERRIARRRVERDYDKFVQEGVEPDGLELGEFTAGLAMVYNFGGVGGNSGFAMALKALSAARTQNKDQHITSLYRDAARGYIDVMRTPSGYNTGLMARSMTTKEIFDGAMNISGIYDDFLSQSKSSMKADIREQKDMALNFFQQARDDERHFNTYGSYPFRPVPTPSPVRQNQETPEVIDVVPEMVTPTPPPTGVMGDRADSIARTLDTINPLSRMGEKM